MSNEYIAGDPKPLVGVVNPPDLSSSLAHELSLADPENKVADPARVQILREAAQLIVGDRQRDYGTPSENFKRIADLWNVQLAHLLGEGKKFQAHDVALAMVQLKLARLIQTPTEDSFKDAAGYIAIAWETSLDRTD